MKKPVSNMIRVLFGSLMILSLISCASTANIQAVDSKDEIDKDVKIYVDGKYLSDGTASYSDKKTVYSAVPFLELKKEGCKTQREKLDVETNWMTSIFGSVLAGIGIGLMSAEILNPANAVLYGLPTAVAGLAILFWTRSYVPFQKLEFQCLKIAEE